jgi:hypothetical protein
MMPEPPCRGCKHEKLSKLIPMIWLVPVPKRLTKRQAAKHIPGLNYPNPCPCDLARAYDDQVSTTFPSIPTYRDFDGVLPLPEGVEA